MIKLDHTTIVIGLRIDSRSRLNNAVATISYILKNIDCPLIVYEVDKESKFKRDALTKIKHFASTKRLTHIFEKRDDGLFSYSDVSNKAIKMAWTKVVFHCDCDFIIPPTSFKEAEKLVLEGAHIVYPFKGPGMIKNVQLNDKTLKIHLLQRNNLDVLNRGRIHRWLFPYGLGKFINKEMFFSVGGLDDRMKSYGPEDSEFYFRSKKLGLNIKRLQSGGWHLYHSRRTEGWFKNNPYGERNQGLTNKTKSSSVENIVEMFKIDVDKIRKLGAVININSSEDIHETTEGSQ